MIAADQRHAVRRLQGLLGKHDGSNLQEVTEGITSLIGAMDFTELAPTEPKKERKERKGRKERGGFDREG